MPSTWTALLLSATLAGAAVCASLVFRRRASTVFSFIFGTLLAMTLYSIAVITRWTGRASIGLIAGAIAIGALIGGFMLAASLVPGLVRTSTARPKARVATGAGCAVVIVAEGQPEHYDPAVMTQSFERLAATDVPLPPLAVRVFAYLAERGRYRRAGISPSRPVVRALATRARDLLRREGFDGEVTEAWLHGTPRLCDVVADLAGTGIGQVAVVLLDVAESYEYDLAIRELTSPPCGAFGVTVATSPPLWSDGELVRLVCDKALASLPGGPRESDGVAVVATGQPPQWDSTHPASTEHRTFFCQRVRATLVDRGLQEAHVRTAWLDWHDPDVTEVVRHLSAVGCQRIVVVPATWVADDLEVAVDLPSAVRDAAVDENVKVEVLHAWGDDETVAQVIAKVARETLMELGSWEDLEDQ